jgi:hypothetical protein
MTFGVPSSARRESDVLGDRPRKLESSGVFMGHEFHKVWIEQCDATEGIADHFGKQDAIRYLVGEKFINFLLECDRRPEFVMELPHFTARVKEIFEPEELSDFLESLLHDRAAEKDKDWPFDDFEDAEIDPSDVVDEAETIFLIERAKELLLG